MSAQGVFITATDTGVGKTVVTALLLAHLRRRSVNAVAMKPISSGDRDDGRLLHELADCPGSLDLVNPVHFRNPLAPFVAARLERHRWSTAPILRKYATLANRHDVVLVEGIGGLLVPLRRRYFVRDLVCEMNLPILIVTRPGLGTLNHTLLTIQAARDRRIPVLGIIFNQSYPPHNEAALRTNAAAVEELSGVKVLAQIPYLSSLRCSVGAIRAAVRRPTVERSLRVIVRQTEQRRFT